MGDCHLGSWRDPKLKALGTEAFIKAIDICITRKVDFVLISGDLFDTSIPGIDILEQCAKTLKCLKDEGIPAYIIPGSHDFSPSEKTMLKVLEASGLAVDVVKGKEKDGKLVLRFTKDRKTGVKLAGMLGRKGALEKEYYEVLDRKSLEAEDGFRIFMFHSAVEERKPKHLKDMEGIPMSLLPKGFGYYAGGHVHERSYDEKSRIAFPGPTFPTNFKEMEGSGRGGFYIVKVSGDSLKSEWVPCPMPEVERIIIDASGKTPENVAKEIGEDRNVKDKIVLIRVSGILKEGRPSDVGFREICERFEKEGAFAVKINIGKLMSKEFESMSFKSDTVDDIESEIIREHKESLKPFNDTGFLKELSSCLKEAKDEGETSASFEARISENTLKIMEDAGGNADKKSEAVEHKKLW